MDKIFFFFVVDFCDPMLSNPVTLDKLFPSRNYNKKCIVNEEDSELFFFDDINNIAYGIHLRFISLFCYYQKTRREENELF